MAKKKTKGAKLIARKMRAMKGEKKPRAQKIAIAMSYARKHGARIPKK